jgi:hypothetical protein
MGNPFLAHENKIRVFLIEKAENEQITHYGDLARLCGYSEFLEPYRYLLGELLGIISDKERQAGRPLLSSIVVDREEMRPGAGFASTFNDTGMDENEFWVKNMQETFRYWRTQKEKRSSYEKTGKGKR